MCRFQVTDHVRSATLVLRVDAGDCSHRQNRLALAVAGK